VSWGNTYALLLVTLDDGERPLVLGVLHDEPRQRLAVLAVDLAGLDELGLELGNALGRVLGVQVDDDCVDHGGRWVSVLGACAGKGSLVGIGVSGRGIDVVGDSDDGTMLKAGACKAFLPGWGFPAVT
jgi:hypothetical protein